MRSQQGNFQFHYFFFCLVWLEMYIFKSLGFFSVINDEPSSTSSVMIFWWVGEVTTLQLVLSLLVNLNFCRCCVFYFHILSCIACSLRGCRIVCWYLFSVNWKFIFFLVEQQVWFFKLSLILAFNRRTFSSSSTSLTKKKRKGKKGKK